MDVGIVSRNQYCSTLAQGMWKLRLYYVERSLVYVYYPMSLERVCCEPSSNENITGLTMYKLVLPSNPLLHSLDHDP